MRYAIVNRSTGEVLNVIELEPGANYPLPPGCKLAADGEMPEPVLPVERRLIPKSLIVQRLHAAGKLAAASAALDADDAEALALLTAIGADPEIILAP